MRRIFVFLSLVLMVGVAKANIYVPASVLGTVVTKHFADANTDAVAAVQSYHDMIADGKGITVDGMYRVCMAGGFDIKVAAGKAKCDAFVNELMELGTIKYYKVCNADKGKSGGKEICVNDFFTNKLYGGTQVDVRNARGLALEYIRVKYNDDTAVCAENYYECKSILGAPEYCITCTSATTKTYYDFVFDDAVETKDEVITDSIENALCRLYDTNYSPSGMTPDRSLGNGTRIPGKTWPASCATTDRALCGKISTSATRFGRSAVIGDVNGKNACVLKNVGPSDKSKLRTTLGIDNMAFRNGGIQLQADSSLDSQIKTFVISEIAPTPLSSFKCNDAPTPLYDFSGMITEIDDVLTCYVNGQPVDFLFDDLSESWKTTARGGKQGMECIVSGGTFTGQNCTHLNEKQCKTLAAQNIVNCPECKAVQWNDEYEVCVLPSSKSAENLNKGLKIGGTIIGGALGVVGSAALIISTAPLSGFVAVSTIILEAGSIVGTAIEVSSQIKISQQAQNFLTEVAKCNNASCAERHFAESFQRMVNMAPDFTDAEINAIDSEFAKLVELLPKNSVIYTGSIQDNQLALTDPNSWEPEQVWRAVGIGLQLLPMAFSVGVKVVDMVSKNGSKIVDVMDQTTDALKSGYKAARTDNDMLNVVVKETDKKIDLYFSTDEEMVAFNSLGQNERMPFVWAYQGFGEGMSFDEFVKLYDGDINKLQDAISKAFFMTQYKTSDVGMSFDEFVKMYDGDVNKLRDALRREASYKTNLQNIKDKYAVVKAQMTDEELKLFENMSEADVEILFEAYQAVVPKNEKFMHFIASIGGDTDQAKRMTQIAKKANSLTQADINKQVQAVNKKLQQIVDDMWEKYPDMTYGQIMQTDEYKQAAAPLDELGIIQNFKNGEPLYTTYDPELSAIKRAHGTAVTTAETKGERSLIDAQTIRATQDLVDERTTEMLAKQRRSEYLEIVGNDDELLKMANNFENLTDAEKQYFGQRILNASDRLHCIGDNCEFRLRSATQPGVSQSNAGSYVKEDNVMYLVKENRKTLDEFMETLAHEDGHRIDYNKPEQGALGSQASVFGDDIYLNSRYTNYATYRANMAEQSSFKIGEIVGSGFKEELMRLFGHKLSK